MAVALGTVFLLNSIAPLLFPVLGWAQHLNQTQFGLWSALAIHDTRSVVGATAKYGAVALPVGTTVKLARALWIVPVSVLTSMFMKSKSRIQWPWFIGLFCLAAMANTYVPFFGFAYPVLSHLGRLGLTVTLFLIGTGLSAATLRQVGVRPIVAESPAVGDRSLGFCPADRSRLDSAVSRGPELGRRLSINYASDLDSTGVLIRLPCKSS
jgi:uncharacterized membrane protein YadS